MKPSDISVTISLYNKEKTIERAVNSILNQTFQPKEIIIVDDGSRDNSPDIANQLAQNHDMVSCIRQENLGVSVARNTGVYSASTPFICLLDADDVWESDYISNLMELYCKVNDADMYCLAHQLKTEGRLLKQKVALTKGFCGEVSDVIETYSKGYGLIHTSAVCFRKSFFEKAGGFPEGVNFGEDLYLWLKTGLEGKVAFNDKISVTLHKEPVNSINRRKLFPYHIAYFTDNLKAYSQSEQKSLKAFLIKNICIQWAAAKIEKNRWQCNILRKYAYKLSFLTGLMLQISEWLPSKIFVYLKERRIKKRIKN